jgi:hypothetical protein
MKVHVTGELEADALRRQAGPRPEEARLVEAVHRGEEALQRGEYLTHEQVGQRLQRFLETNAGR